jgi:3',5'-cyclic-AMP phosphodiesterase
MDATPYLLVQLSDPHITHPGRLISGRVDTAAALRHAVERVLQIRPRPVAVLISGDLVDAGHPAEYAQLRELLQPLLAAGLPLALLPGNHDARGPLQQAFAGLPRVYCGEAGATAIQYALDLPGPLRLIVLDSLVDGRPEGGLDEGRLAQAQACWPSGLPCPPSSPCTTRRMPPASRPWTAWRCSRAWPASRR